MLPASFCQLWTLFKWSIDARGVNTAKRDEPFQSELYNTSKLYLSGLGFKHRCHDFAASP